MITPPPSDMSCCCKPCLFNINEYLRTYMHERKKKTKQQKKELDIIKLLIFANTVLKDRLEEFPIQFKQITGTTVLTDTPATCSCRLKKWHHKKHIVELREMNDPLTYQLILSNKIQPQEQTN